MLTNFGADMKVFLLLLATLFSISATAQNNKINQLHIIEQLAKQGEASAQYQLAEHYLAGYGIEQSDELAFKWYKKAAEQGHAAAMFNLATAYDLGEGVDADLQTAAKWYEKSALLGEASAAYNLGIMYEEGAGLKKDLLEANVWLRLAELLEHELAHDALSKNSILLAPKHKQTIEQKAQRLFEQIQAAKSTANEP